MHNNITERILFGSSYKSKIPSISNKKIQNLLSFKNSNTKNGLLSKLFYKYEGFAQLELPNFQGLISDCGKLKLLDQLLTRLYSEGHRVLIFCQMTRMLDILEEYMSKKRYTYFRMDGSTNIADRRDMVNEFQVNPNIFSFLLSTRAGGLGVNLTGADTVIFYDNDWNPTMDAQATDRAHRIGQTKPVSVYRLITKNTIEERILKRAKQKQNVQATVYAGGAFKADIFKPREIVELLYGEEEVQKIEMEKKINLDHPQTNKAENSNNSNKQLGQGHNNVNSANEGENSKKKKKGSKGKNKEDKEGKDGKEPKEGKSKKSKGDKNKGETKQLSLNKNTLGKFAVTNTASAGTTGVTPGGNKNIFSVRNTKSNALAMKCDSSDEENNVIIGDDENILMDDQDQDDDMDI